MLCRVPHRSISTRLQQRRCRVANAISVPRSAVQIALSSRQWSLTGHLFKSFARGFLCWKGSYDSSFDFLHGNMFVFWRSSSNMSDLVGPEYQGCVDGSLMDGFSVFIQGLLAVLAFSTLMCKFLSLFKPNRKWNDVCVWCDSVFFFFWLRIWCSTWLGVCLFTVLIVVIVVYGDNMVQCCFIYTWFWC